MDSVSGQSVPHALVKLTAPSPHAALTDSEGKFQFEGLPAGSATLEAAKPGYLSPGMIGAIEKGWDLEWADPKVMFQYLPAGQPFELKPNASLTLNPKVQ